MTHIRNARIQQLVGPRLQTLAVRNNRTGLLFLAAHSLLSAATGCVLWLSLGSWWAAPAMLLHGIVLVHWFAPFHESVHGTAFASPWLNRATAWLSGLLIGLVPPHFKYEHAAHHAYTADPDKDPERIPQGETLTGYLYYASAVPYFKSLLSTLVRLPFGRFNAEEQRFIPRRRLSEVRRAAVLMWLVYGLVIMISVWMQSWAALTLWLLPRIVGEPVMRLIRMSEHVGCEPVADMLRNTRSVRTNRALRWLAWNMNLHVEHHALPQVPFHALPRLHNILREHLVYCSDGYPQAQRALICNALNNRQSGEPLRYG